MEGRFCKASRLPMGVVPTWVLRRIGDNSFYGSNCKRKGLEGLSEEYDTPARLLENKSSTFAKLEAEYTEVKF
ncbi:hypothetical protein VitviT2T_029966 [Vitis vinifera]|uniref:Uncharacterized protein n=1 Tax=Vitis vinifera TaxID=29760 RepID=A0ABY9E0B0_VITVI|nr:hypothetical protein VitviT2T_029966 [Vitis vinifera]